MKTLKLGGISYSLNKQNHSADITNSPYANGDVIIPCSIIYEYQEYFITCITSNSFTGNKTLNSIKFAENSKLRTISKDSFLHSNLSNIEIPESVEELEEGWCNETSQLFNVSISAKNPNYKYINNAFIIGKSDKNNNNYDVINFSRRNIEQCVIPSNIKRICSYSFANCSKLDSIEFSEDSELNSIGEKAFFQSSISKISIPNHVLQIEDQAFSCCRNLKTVTFSKKSELEIIGKNSFLFTSIEKVSIPSHVKQIGQQAFSRCKNLETIEIPEDSELKVIDIIFYSSSIKSLFIPESIEKLEKGWCYCAPKLTNVLISNKNKNFSFLNEKIIVGKTNPDNNIFDAIVFVNKNANEVFIPSYIKKIDCFAFSNCNINSIQFEEKSCLNLIDDSAFIDSKISRISIPSNVNRIGISAFFGCEKLNRIDFEMNSELKIIEAQAFSYSSLKSISIPSKVKTIEKDAFSMCDNLIAIEILTDCFLNLGYIISECKCLSIISIPNNLEIFIGTFDKSFHSSNLSLFTCPGAKLNIK